MSEYVTAWTDDLPGMTHGEEIVRCRDCLHVSYDGVLSTGWCNENCREVHPFDFCSFGERRRIMSEYVYATNGTPVSDTDGEVSLPREQIIRCRDCKHLRRDDPWWECHRAGFYVGAVDGSEPGGFCKWGRKVQE